MAAHRPRIPIYAMTNRIRAARRTTILPGVESLIVEEKPRARSTVAEAVKQLYESKKFVRTIQLLLFQVPLSLSQEEPRQSDFCLSTKRAN